MQTILAWVAFPLVLTALGAGWGVLVEKAIGHEVPGALLVALGLMAALVAAAIVTASSATAPAAVAVVAAIGAAGLAAAWPGGRIARWPLLAAIGALLAYGAPVLLSGHATFAGYITLDDTSTWLGITDQMFAHSRAVAATPPSTYQYVLDTYLHLTGYPVGGFMLLGVGRGLVGIDAAWAIQPYLAVCGALVGLAAYALFEPFVASRPLRAGLAFVAAQPALLYGYSLWGGIKELTAAWVLIAGLALIAPYVGRAAPRPREMLLLALPATALVSTVGAGSLAWIGPPSVVLIAGWGRAAWRERATRKPLLASCAALIGATALLSLPALLVLSKSLATDVAVFVTPTGQANDVQAMGTLLAPLSPFQLAGIWPVGDFRLVAPTVPTAILVALVLASAIFAAVLGARRRLPAVALYAGTAVVGVAAVKVAGGAPWVVGKALAIGSPAVLAAGLLGGALLLAHRRAAGIVVCALLAAGVLWSNVLAYHDVRLAPRARLAELQRIGGMIAGRGPTLVDEDEVYATRHFLRAGSPTAPTEYRQVALKLLGGQELGAGAHADLDSYPLQTLLYYRSIVTSRSPTESRPPSAYRLVWEGRWYQLWQRSTTPRELPVLHVPGGDSNVLPYCGRSDKGPRDLCSVDPTSVPPCAGVTRIGAIAARAGGSVVAFQREQPIVMRASAGRVPAGWEVARGSGTVTPVRPGTMSLRFRLAAGHYGVWLGGTFGRGFTVSVDGRSVGRVRDLRQGVGAYEHAGTVKLGHGEHTFSLHYPHGGLGPGGGREKDTSLAAVALDPLDGVKSQMLSVSPAAVKTLCGRPLDWIEIVEPRTSR